MHQKALFKICFKNLPLAGGCSCAPPATSLRLSPVTSALPKTRIHYCSNIKHIEKKYNIQIWNNIPGIISGGFYNKQWPTMKWTLFLISLFQLPAYLYNVELYFLFVGLDNLLFRLHSFESCPPFKDSPKPYFYLILVLFIARFYLPQLRFSSYSARCCWKNPSH